MARRQQLKELTAPFSGIDQSRQSTLIPDGMSPSAQNTFYDYGEIIQREGSIEFGTTATTAMPFSEEVQGIANYFADDGGTTLLCVTDTNIYTYASGGDNWTAITPVVDMEFVDSGTGTNKHMCFLTTGGGGGTEPENAGYATNWVTTPYLNDTKEAWSATTYTQGTTLTADTTAYLSFTHATHLPPLTGTLTAGKYLVICNGTDPIMIYDGTTLVPLRTYDTGSTYTYYQAKQVIYFNSVLIQIGVTEVSSGDASPQQILWSAVGDILDWDATSSASNSGLFILNSTAGELVRGEIIGNEALAVYKSDSIYLLTPSGSNSVFNVSLKVRGTGLISAGALAILEDRHIIIGSDGFYSYSGGSNVKREGDNVWREFITDLDYANKHRIRASVDRENSRVKFYFPSISEVTNAGSNTRAIVYDYREDWWSIQELGGNVTALGSVTDVVTRPWSGESTTWTDAVGTWTEATPAPASPLTLFGDSGGYITKLDPTVTTEYVGGVKTNITQVHQTKDFTSVDMVGQDYKDREILWQGLILDAKSVTSGNVKVEYNTDEGNGAWTEITASQALTTTYQRYKLDFRVSSRQIRFRFTNSDAYDFKLRSRLGIRFIARGRV